jgi:hypothetical protein
LTLPGTILSFNLTLRHAPPRPRDRGPGILGLGAGKIQHNDRFHQPDSLRGDLGEPLAHGFEKSADCHHPRLEWQRRPILRQIALSVGELLQGNFDGRYGFALIAIAGLAIPAVFLWRIPQIHSPWRRVDAPTPSCCSFLARGSGRAIGQPAGPGYP